MARKKITKDQTKSAIQLDNEQSNRMEKISNQTGLSQDDLLQKWILQEESLIGLMQKSNAPTPKEAKEKAAKPSVSTRKASTAKEKSAKAIPNAADSSAYRKTVIKKVERLKKIGMTLKEIANTFNEQKVVTMSGSGKWYASSVKNILNSKK
jgi:hypothetical protein